MLKHLSIQNYALIASLEMDPSSKLNIITGETGAGKSIMLGAVGLLLGNRADTKVLFNPDEKCVIEGHFDLTPYRLKSFFADEDLDYEDITIIRRDISKAGKSRAFVNDLPVTLDVLKKLGVKLMDIHSQHDNLQLGDQLYQMNVLDLYAENQDLLLAYNQAYKSYKKATKAYETLKAEASRLREEADFHQFQFEELEKANLKPGEEEALDQELEALENAEDIKLKLNQAITGISGEEFAATDQLKTAQNLLQQLSRFGDQYTSLQERLQSALIEIEDINVELGKLEEKILHDPARIEEVKDRVSLIFSLQQKHRVKTIDELIEIRQQLEEKVLQTANLDEALEQAKNDYEKALAVVKEAGEELSESRQSVVIGLKKQLEELLTQLGMPNAQFEVAIEEADLGQHGTDSINFLFSANKGIAPQDIRQVASGGEFSRLMFCIKYILASKTALPTIIFDEIDTGVSGEVAKKMVNMMKTMANSHQVIAISHLPQFAAKGDQHYFVFKDDSQHKTISRIKTLTGEQRILEIAKMIDGENPSPNALQSARDLIEA